MGNLIAIKGRIVTPESVVRGTLLAEGGCIVRIADEPPRGARVYDFGDALVLPGFIDVHLHGLGPFGMFKAEDIAGAAELQLQYGTTAFLPSEGCLPEEGYIEFAANVRKAMKVAEGKGARILGAHFEGPFINPHRKGGMEESTLRPMSLRECRRYVEAAGDVLRLMTLSPELEGSREVIQLLRTHGVVVSLGHSTASGETLRQAVAAGLAHVCHLFNTFARPTEREPGVWEPGLVEHILTNPGVNCEIICDMHHVLPEYVRLAAKVLGPDRFVAITDSMEGAGAEPGEHRMVDGRRYSTAGGIARLIEDGKIVGSVLTMNRAFANLVDCCGIDPVMAARFTSTNAARALGLADRIGAIMPGKSADVAVLDARYDCIAAFIGGVRLYGR